MRLHSLLPHAPPSSAGARDLKLVAPASGGLRYPHSAIFVDSPHFEVERPRTNTTSLRGSP